MFFFFVNRINIHSLREHLAFEMIEEDRLKKGVILEEITVKTPRKRLNKTAVLSQHRPDIRDVVKRSSIIHLLSFIQTKILG